jgi:hypothetical protein
MHKIFDLAIQMWILRFIRDPMLSFINSKMVLYNWHGKLVKGNIYGSKHIPTLISVLKGGGL